MVANMQIAILENDTRAAQLLDDWLRGAGYVAKFFGSGTAFSREINGATFMAAVLGSAPTDMRAAEICASLRERMSGVPLLRILQKGGEEDIVNALKAGADDCMANARQFELLARLEALTRRVKHVQPVMENLLDFGNLSIDLKNRLILRDGARVALTPKTYNLAVFLLSNSGQLLSRGYLLEHVWGHDKSASTRTLDTHISRLRTVLGLTPEYGWHLQSVYQHGYRLDRIETGKARAAEPPKLPVREPAFG